MGTVIALCAVLLLKWLAVVALIAWGVTVLVRWLWRRRYRPLTPDAGTAPAPDHGLGPVLPAPRPDEARAGDCSWCGLAGGHRDLRGRPVRPRLAHAVRAGTAPAR